MKESGTSILGLLGIAFIVLKLTEVISWSWWWVTLPFWGGLAIVIPLFLIITFFKFKNSRDEPVKYPAEKQTQTRKSAFQQRLDQAIKNQEERFGSKK